jgi:hypothetical protein
MTEVMIVDYLSSFPPTHALLQLKCCSIVYFPVDIIQILHVGCVGQGFRLWWSFASYAS